MCLLSPPSWLMLLPSLLPCWGAEEGIVGGGGARRAPALRPGGSSALTRRPPSSCLTSGCPRHLGPKVLTVVLVVTGRGLVGIAVLPQRSPVE